MQPLSKIQYETLEYIKSYKLANGYMPTQKEIGIHFKISLGGATGQRMKKLIEKGYIQRTQGPRGYAIIEN